MEEILAGLRSHPPPEGAPGTLNHDNLTSLFGPGYRESFATLTDSGKVWGAKLRKTKSRLRFDTDSLLCLAKAC